METITEIMRDDKSIIKITKQPVCKNCGSAFIYVTKKKVICRRCGHEEKRE